MAGYSLRNLFSLTFFFINSGTFLCSVSLRIIKDNFTKVRHKEHGEKRWKDNQFCIVCVQLRTILEHHNYSFVIWEGFFSNNKYLNFVFLEIFLNDISFFSKYMMEKFSLSDFVPLILFHFDRRQKGNNKVGVKFENVRKEKWEKKFENLSFSFEI